MILVTGATGLVGGHLIWHLLQTNNSVFATKRAGSNTDNLRRIFRFYTDSPDSFLNRIVWREADVTNFASIEMALNGINTVYHCAAVVSLSNNSDKIIKNNVEGTANIVKAALNRKISRFCFVSSIAACGSATEKSGLITENNTLTGIESRSAYAQSKYLSEEEVWKGIRAGLSAVIVNPGVIIGYSGTDRGSSELFARVRKGLPFYTNGGSGYVDVQDVVKIMIQIAESNIHGERYVLCGRNCSNKEILSWIAEGYAKPKPVIPVGKKLMLAIGLISEIISKLTGTQAKLDRSMAKSASNRSYYSSEKIKNQLGYEFNDIRTCILEVCKADLRI